MDQPELNLNVQMQAVDAALIARQSSFTGALIKKRDRDFLSGPIGSLVYSAAVDCCMDGDLDIAKVGMAIQAARSARFEFGECGAAA